VTEEGGKQKKECAQHYRNAQSSIQYDIFLVPGFSN